MTGTVFDIKEFTVHDGPGARVTVFLKGCPLRCIWCHNPEGLSSLPQLSVRESACRHCGACMTECQHPECKKFSRCIHACPMGLITVKGEEYDSDTLANKLLGYAPFLKDGGITFSGGEPLMQHKFLCDVLDKTKSLHRAIETSGYAKEEVFRKVIEKCDYVIMDIKLSDSALHKKYTGVDNSVILKNYKTLVESGIPHVIRIPLIPGITDTEENLEAIAKITRHSDVELLRFNRMAGAKYKELGLEFPEFPRENTDIDLSIFSSAIIL